MSTDVGTLVGRRVKVIVDGPCRGFVRVDDDDADGAIRWQSERWR